MRTPGILTKLLFAGAVSNRVLRGIPINTDSVTKCCTPQKNSGEW